jgi:MFS family permease
MLHATRRRGSELRLISSLQYRDSRRFWGGTGIASVAQAMFLVASGWYAFRLRGGGGVGVVTFATMGPLLVATPIGGLLADRIDRRALVIAVEIVQCAVAATLAVAGIRGTLPFGVFVAFVFLSGVARAVELTTTQAIVPNLVPPQELLNVLALNTLATLGSRFVGPALAAPVLAAAGARAAYPLIAALYLPALALILRIPAMPHHGARVVSLVEQVREGGRYIRDHAILGLLLGVVILHCALTMSFDATLPLIAQANLRGSSGIYSALVAATGLGAIVGTVLLAGVPTGSLRGRLFLISGVGSGVATLLMANAQRPLFALAALVLAGMSQATFMTLAMTFVQEALPNALRGRVGGLFLMSAGGVMSLCNLANGYLADRYGSALILGVPAAVFIALFVALGAVRPTLRRLYGEGRLPIERVAAVVGE